MLEDQIFQKVSVYVVRTLRQKFSLEGTSFLVIFMQDKN